jgi:hypothetical protein
VRSSVRRLLAGATVSGLLASGAVVTPADAAPTPRARAAAGWLAGELDRGVIHNDQFDFDDYGLTLDVFFTLETLQVKPAIRAQILRAVEPHVGVYVSPGKGTFSGPVAKLLTAVETAGIAPSSYGDGRLLPTLTSLVRKSGQQAGRAKDTGPTDYSNTIGQSYAVRAFALAHRSRMAKLTTRFLLKQQCPAGFFREGMESRDFTCRTGRRQHLSAPSVDSTAFAVLALRSARHSGVRGVRDDIRSAVHWLRAHQNRNGSFRGNGEANANTTGLAAAVLAGPAPRAAARAAAWLRKRQATLAKAHGTPLRKDLGAVAYDPAAFRAGLTSGIEVGTRDQWRRATAQAAIGLDAARR